MGTTTMVEVLVEGNPADPYRYGWRYVRRLDEHGRERWERVPLTLADVLHPQEGDVVIQNSSHGRRRRYLVEVFDAQLAGDPGAAVLEDVQVAWDVPDLRPHAPDISVILGVREQREWSTFDVAEEGVRPALIVEITSPSTASVDRATKLEHYELVAVPLYVIVDAVSRGQPAPPRLLGYRLEAGRYRQMAPDERGRLWLGPVRLWLGVEADEIVCQDADGRVLGDYRSLAAAYAAAEEELAAAERRILAAEGARAEAERRAAALEAELRRLRDAAGGPSTPPATGG